MKCEISGEVVHRALPGWVIISASLPSGGNVKVLGEGPSTGPSNLLWFQKLWRLQAYSGNLFHTAASTNKFLVLFIRTLNPRAEIPSITNVLTTLWKLPMANLWKRPFWEVIADGQLTAERIRANTMCGCACPERPGRTHHYLLCLAARFLYGNIESWTSAGDLITKIWTVTPPHPNTHDQYGDSSALQQLMHWIEPDAIFLNEWR